MWFEGKGYGKAILLGEHFVVHGARGIGIGIPLKTVVRVRRAPSIAFSVQCGDLLKEATRRILKRVAGDVNFEVWVESWLPAGAGVGWSASYCVALARAAAKAIGKKMENAEVAEIAFEGEKVFHGNPSGIDNALAAHGGVLIFRKGRAPEAVALGGKFHFVIANSGKKRPTKELVEMVSSFREGKPEEYRAMEEAEDWLVEKALEALRKGDAETLGKVMNNNNELLARLGLSTPKIEEIRRIALEEGALGAKITGAGGGGCVLILAPDARKAKEIAGKLKEFEAFSFTL